MFCNQNRVQNYDYSFICANFSTLFTIGGNQFITIDTKKHTCSTNGWCCSLLFLPRGFSEQSCHIDGQFQQVSFTLQVLGMEDVALPYAAAELLLESIYGVVLAVVA